MTDARNEILDNWERQLTAMDEADTESLRECFTADAVLVHMTGYRQPLDEWLDGMRRKEFVYHQVIEKSVDVQVDGGRAELVGDIVTGYRADGSGQAWPLRVVQQFARVNEQWRCVESRVTLG